MTTAAKSKPVLTVASARVIAWHGDLLSVVLREGRKRLRDGGVRWVLPGGKIGRRQTFTEVIREEMLEELGLPPAASLNPVTVLHMVNRETWYSARKWRKLGYGLPGKVAGSTRILLANPVAHIYAAQVDTPPPECHAGRQLRLIDLRDERTLDTVKPSHATVLAHWRESVLAGRSMPREVHWTDSILAG
ncbi:MAG: NUDIX domain-containing protein [Verrucomicrobia bacterium]|nr:NUDIX domain-containing protein [Verrucomicrobiota bacterium]